MEAFDPIALFKRSARAWPEREALRVQGRSITYAELDRWSGSIARTILEAGADNERIAFLADLEASSYATILGILKAGCSYVPLHPDGPSARWTSMIERCGARFGIKHSKIAVPAPQLIVLPTLEEAQGTIDEMNVTDREAYVLFTSGSTGGPKGVSVLRANVAAYLRNTLSMSDFNERDRFTQFFALTFDLSVHDLFVCWGAGACLCVPPEDSALRAAEFVRENGITVWFSVPALPAVMQRMRALAPNAMPSLRLAFFCGEALPWATVRSFSEAAPRSRIINLYGPTETTIATTSFEVDLSRMPTEGIVPIGQVFPQHASTIVGDELHLSGPQVSAGYVNDPAANAKNFVQLPGSTARWYRTGDRVRMDEAGIMHFAGRIDDQVKVLGHRVEPGEVDALLEPRLHSGRSITVPVHEAGATRLVTFINVTADIPELLAYCRQQLPSYMVPERIAHIATWPLTPHGKVDRQRLIAIAAHG